MSVREEAPLGAREPLRLHFEERRREMIQEFAEAEQRARIRWAFDRPARLRPVELEGRSEEWNGSG